MSLKDHLSGINIGKCTKMQAFGLSASTWWCMRRNHTIARRSSWKLTTTMFCRVYHFILLDITLHYLTLLYITLYHFISWFVANAQSHKTVMNLKLPAKWPSQTSQGTSIKRGEGAMLRAYAQTLPGCPKKHGLHESLTTTALKTSQNLYFNMFYVYLYKPVVQRMFFKDASFLTCSYLFQFLHSFSSFKSFKSFSSFSSFSSFAQHPCSGDLPSRHSPSKYRKIAWPPA